MLRKCIFYDLHSWSSDNQNDNIFEPEGSFSGVYNTFVNLRCEPNDKNVLKLVFRLHTFPKLLKCWRHMHPKNLNLPRNQNDTNFSILVKPQN